MIVLGLTPNALASWAFVSPSASARRKPAGTGLASGITPPQGDQLEQKIIYNVTELRHDVSVFTFVMVEPNEVQFFGGQNSCPISMSPPRGHQLEEQSSSQMHSAFETWVVMHHEHFRGRTTGAQLPRRCSGVLLTIVTQPRP